MYHDTDVIQEPTPVEQPAAPGSLRDRLAAKRQELMGERTFLLPIPGYDGIIAARYRPLSYEALRRIIRKNGSAADNATAESELATALDVLIQANVELVERDDEGAYRTLDVRWSLPAAIADLFQIQAPEGATARYILQEVFAGNSMAVMTHFQDYDAQMGTAIGDVDEEQRGNSEASSATLSSWR